MKDLHWFSLQVFLFEDYNMNFYEHEIIVGAIKPFQFLHMTDTHLTYADSRDDQRKTGLAQHRKRSFPS